MKDMKTMKVYSATLLGPTTTPPHRSFSKSLVGYLGASSKPVVQLGESLYFPPHFSTPKWFRSQLRQNWVITIPV